MNKRVRFPRLRVQNAMMVVHRHGPHCDYDHVHTDKGQPTRVTHENGGLVIDGARTDYATTLVANDPMAAVSNVLAIATKIGVNGRIELPTGNIHIDNRIGRA